MRGRATAVQGDTQAAFEVEFACEKLRDHARLHDDATHPREQRSGTVVTRGGSTQITEPPLRQARRSTSR